jgi:hypothetical protein
MICDANGREATMAGGAARGDHGVPWAAVMELGDEPIVVRR